MDAAYLINAVGFYVRRSRRLERAAPGPLNAEVEAALWDYAGRAADRLERLQQAERIPVPVKRRSDESPDAR